MQMHPDAVERYARTKEQGAALYPENVDGSIAEKPLYR